MKKIDLRFPLFIFLLVCAAKLKAQTITTVESRCANTGEVIFSGSIGAGGPYQLSAISYPPEYIPAGIHFTPTLPDTFPALFPGSYTFQVKDHNGAVFNYPDITVTGNYVLPGNNNYTPVTTNVTSCTSPNGTISGTMTNGRPPYTYTIIDGPAQVGIANATGTFTGLPAGTYKVQAADSCQNAQTRNAIIASNSGSFSITKVSIKIVNCNTYSLDTLLISPSFPQGGHYEVINYNSSGEGTVRASGNSVPVNFSLFSSRDVPNGRVTIKLYDTCGHVISYTPTGYTNYLSDTVITGAINRTGCGRYSLDELTVVPAFPPGTMVQLTNTATGVVYNDALPLPFEAQPGDISNGNIVIKLTDQCGNVASTNSIRALNNSWSFSSGVKIYCSAAVIDGIHLIGFAVQPCVVRVKALFTDSSGHRDSTATQLITSFPYTVTGIPADANPLTIRIEVTDSCGEVRRVILTQSLVASVASVVFKNCDSVVVRVNPLGRYVFPVTFSVLPDPGVGTNTTGIFELPDGTYSFTARDSCGKKDTYPPITVSRKWELLPVRQSKGCTAASSTHKICVPAKSIGPLTIRQYEGGMPVSSSSVLLSTRTFISDKNRCAICNSTDTTKEKIEIDNTLPGHTYSYIVTDSCGNSDTVSAVNEISQPFYHAAVSKSKCIRGSDIYAKWKSNGDPSNSVIIEVFDANGNRLLGYNSGSTASTDAYPEGQILLYDAAAGIYTIKYSTISCPQVYIDTIFIKDYVQPKVMAVQSFTSCSAEGISVIVTGADGIGPYRYELINSYPGHYTSPLQTDPVFTLPVSQSTATVRIVDACLNAITRTVAITRALPPSIHINPALLSTCTLPFTVSLFTDSVYDGSVFEWTKLTGTGAGAAVIGRSASFTVVYNTIADTATYGLRVTVPGTCFDMSSAFTLNNVLVTCTPGLVGNVLNDANGLTDGTVNGYGTNAEGLNAVLINAANVVAASSPVSATGTYSFAEVTTGTYSVIISTTPGVINTTPPAATLPPGWVNTGEHAGTATGSDGAINGRLANIFIDTVIVPELNFGIDRIPIANDTVESRTNPGGILQVSVPVLTGSDAEDGTYDGVSGINSVIIQSLPPNAILYYNGSPVTIGQVISNYAPALLTLDPFDNIPSAQFTFSEVDAAMAVSLPDTVIILFTGLPVTITNVKATAAGGNVQLNWTVEEQLNILNYTVEYSTDGYNFKTIGVVTAANTSSYNFLHTAPADGLNYYRLKIVEFDGNVSYSKIVTVRFNRLPLISVKPNPFKGSVDVVMDLQKTSTVKIFLYDAAGRRMYENVFSGVIGSNHFTMDNLDKLSKGVYIINVLTDAFSFQQKILKE